MSASKYQLVKLNGMVSLVFTVPSMCAGDGRDKCKGLVVGLRLKQFQFRSRGCIFQPRHLMERYKPHHHPGWMLQLKTVQFCSHSTV